MRIKNTGQAALPAIILVASIALTISLAIASLGLTEHNISYNQGLSQKAFDLAQSGAEDAWLKLAKDPSFSGSYILQNALGQCNINIELVGSSKRIVAQGEINQRFRTIEILLTIDSVGKINLSSWQEV